MERHSKVYDAYIRLLNRELIPATGCTEPIAVAYAAALARRELAAAPCRAEAVVSANIIKNVNSVVVPNTGGMKGIEASVAAGAVAGQADKLLDVIGSVSEEQRAGIREFLREVPVKVRKSGGDNVFDITVTLEAGADSVSVRITDYHTNVVSIVKNGEAVFSAERQSGGDEGQQDYELLKLDDIYDFAESAALEDVRDVIMRQIEYNTAISREGLERSYGAEVGRSLVDKRGADIVTMAKASAAAGSDARMSGCEMPVIINSGSGNQGMTASLPVITYADAMGVSEEKKIRALLISNLLTLHLKHYIGRLSAYCGAVSAGSAAGVAIAYLHGDSLKVMSDTLTNAVATASGIVCDGAKPSCAAKIACAVDNGITAWQMAERGMAFNGGDGIVKDSVEQTVASVGSLAANGMRGTDDEIIRIMIGE